MYSQALLVYLCDGYLASDEKYRLFIKMFSSERIFEDENAIMFPELQAGII